MPSTDLDRRLQAALSAGREPDASTEALASMSAELPRRRTRRRLALAGVGASALGALGLTLGLVAGLSAPQQLRTAAPRSVHSTPGTGRSCVEVAVGNGPALCEGHVTTSPSTAVAAPLENTAPFGAATSVRGPTATIRVPVGQRVEVLLPPLSGVTWANVTMAALADRGTPGAGQWSLGVLHHSSGGRTVAVITPADRGRYVLAATGLAACAAATPCHPSEVGWLVRLSVR